MVVSQLLSQQTTSLQTIKFYPSIKNKTLTLQCQMLCVSNAQCDAQNIVAL
jgi:hypothetical protein